MSDALELLFLDLLDERGDDSTSGMPAPTSVASWRVMHRDVAHVDGAPEEREEIDVRAWPWLLCRLPLRARR